GSALRGDGPAPDSGPLAASPAPNGLRGVDQPQSGLRVAEATPSATSDPAEWLNGTPRAGAQALPVPAAAACASVVAVAVAEDSVAVVGVVAAAVGPILCSSTMSFFSATWRTALATIASATTAAIVPMSA